MWRGARWGERWPAWIATGWLVAAAMPAAASSFSLSPIRIYLSPTHRIGVITLRNDGDSAVTIQLGPCAWTQPGGEDHYQATDDLIATPPVFSVAPHGRQIVRVALRRHEDGDREGDYRLFFQEVPQPQSASFTGLRIYLRIGVPLFVDPKPAPKGSLLWQARALGPHELAILATNNGAAHIEVTHFELQAGSGSPPVHVDAARYVLPGSTVSWRVMLPQSLEAHGALHIRGFTDQGEVFADANYAAS
jgi:fimbrial chaperone protein